MQAQIHHGLREAGYGYWGFSPANMPEGGYDVYGVDGIGIEPRRQPVERGQDADRPRLRRLRDLPRAPATPDPPPSAYTNGVVTPHASFLALRYAPRQALANLGRLERNFRGLYGKWGFRDTVNVDSGHVSDFYLSLDQGMIMAALGNALGGDVLRHAYVTRATEQKLRPLLGVEEFNDSPRGCTITGTPGPDHLRGTRAPTSSAASAAMTGSTAAEATTRSSATRAATGWRAATGRTRCTAARTPTPCPAAMARTCSQAAPEPTGSTAAEVRTPRSRAARGRRGFAATRRRTPRRAPRSGGRRRSAGRLGR